MTDKLNSRSTPKVNQFGTPIITIEEYEKQKADYTQKALKELQAQMKMLPLVTKSRNTSSSQSSHSNLLSDNEIINQDDDDQIEDEDNQIDDDDDQIEEEVYFNDTSKSMDNPKVNVIINQFKKNRDNQIGLRKHKITTTTATTTTKPTKPTKPTKTESDDSLMQAVYIQREIDCQELEKFKKLANRLENNLKNEERKNHYLKLDLNNALVDNTNLTIKVDFLTKENTKLKDQEYKNKLTIIILKLLIGVFILNFLVSLIF
jgi:hypothetical protein